MLVVALSYSCTWVHLWLFLAVSYTFVHLFYSALLTNLSLGAGNGKISDILSYSEEALKLTNNDVEWTCERQISGELRERLCVCQWGRGKREMLEKADLWEVTTEQDPEGGENV